MNLFDCMQKRTTEILSFFVEKGGKTMNAYASLTISLEYEVQKSRLELIKLFRLVPRTAKLHLGFLLRGEQDFPFTRYLKNSYFLPKQIFIFNLSKISHSSKIDSHLLLGGTFPNFTWFSKMVTLLQFDLVRNSLKDQQN